MSYIDTDVQKDGYVQYAVLIRGAGVVHATDAENPNPSEDRYTVEEVYRLRLPQNRVTGRGIIIGEGKPENQNHGGNGFFAHCVLAILWVELWALSISRCS